MDKLPPSIYCDLIETLNDKCGEYSILEIWKYERAVIETLTDQDIVDAINTVTESPVFGYETNFTEYLGGVIRYDNLIIILNNIDNEMLIVIGTGTHLGMSQVPNHLAVCGEPRLTRN